MSNLSGSASRVSSQLYPELSPDEIRKALGMVVMAGHNNVPNEIYTAADADTVPTKSSISSAAYWLLNNAGST